MLLRICFVPRKRIDVRDGEVNKGKTEKNLLVNFINDLDNNEFTYRMVFNNKEELRNFKSKIDKQNKINKINVIFN